jgi:hypothetical protein
MRSHSSYVTGPEPENGGQKYRIKKTKASAVHDPRPEVRNPSEEKKPKAGARNFVVKKTAKVDEASSKQGALNEIAIKQNNSKSNQNEKRLKSGIKTYVNSKAKPIEGSPEKIRQENRDGNYTPGTFKQSKVRPESENRMAIAKENAIGDSVKSNKGQLEMMSANQTFGANIAEYARDLTPERAKKLLYLQNNEIKTTFNYFSEENKKLETKIKQLRKERERIEREMANLKVMTVPRVHNNFMQNPIFNDNTNALKQMLKEKKEKVIQVQNELKELRKNLKDESILALTNEGLNFASQIHELKEAIQNFNAEDIESQFNDIQTLKGLNSKLVQQRNALSVRSIEIAEGAESEARPNEPGHQFRIVLQAERGRRLHQKGKRRQDSAVGTT